MTAPDPFLSTAEVAQILACDPDTVRKAIRRGHLAALTYGAVIRIRQSALDAFIDRHMTRGAA